MGACQNFRSPNYGKQVSEKDTCEEFERDGDK